MRKDSSNNKDGINNNTYNLLFSDTFYNVDNEYLNDTAVIIENFTMLNEIDRLIVLTQSDMFKYKNKTYTYNDGEEEYTFSLLEDLFEDDETKRILHSPERYGSCHHASIGMCLNLPHKNSKILTGYINYSDCRILHSVYYYEEDGMEIIYDYTKNIMMRKDEYFRLTNFKLINEIEREKLIEDKNFICNSNISVKAYMVFRDEMMRDIKKNEKVLQLEK
ncbi:MAG: hypothetical protein J6O62_03850 [Bacilli bacterium]|nr:hypothetical protein [Bacilli bacterium]MBO6194805.1 hypothetical protein [Bacilli bacterium]